MFPYLAKIGPVLIPTHAVTWLLAFGIGTIGLFVWAQRIESDAGKILNWIMLCMIATLIGGRVSAIVLLTTGEKFRWFIENPVEIVKLWKGGISLYGMVIGTMLVSIWYLMRKGLPILRFSDFIVPWVTWGVFIQSFGCLGAGCHPGSHTDLPWGIVYTNPFFKGPKGIPLHPFPLYIAILSVPFFLFSWERVNRHYFMRRSFFAPLDTYVKKLIPVPVVEGDLLPLAGMYCAFCRFFVEFTRNPDYQIWYPGFGLSQAHMACIVLFLSSLASYLVIWTYWKCKKEKSPFPRWLGVLLTIFGGMERFSKRVPWTVRDPKPVTSNR